MTGGHNSQRPLSERRPSRGGFDREHPLPHHHPSAQNGFGGPLSRPVDESAGGAAAAGDHHHHQQQQLHHHYPQHSQRRMTEAEVRVVCI